MKIRLKKLIAVGMTAVFLLTGCGAQNTAEVQQTETKVNEFPDALYGEEYIMKDAIPEKMVPLSESPAEDIVTVSAEGVATTPVENAASKMIHIPEASGKIVYGGNSKSKGVTMDASHTDKGYVMIKCSNGSDAKKKVIVQGPSGVKYTYNLNSNGTFETFILSDGNGKYSISVYQNVEGTKYSTLFSQQLDVKLEDQFAPFLNPNQYVNYTMNSNTVKLATQLTAGKTDELEKVQAVYNYVVKNLTYDKQKAQTVQSGYLPEVDKVLAEKKGICFDYAALMTAMLRSQNIPTKLVTGYTGSAYHAWISIYIKETGWIEGVIFFDGVSWKLMDPTFASSSNSSDAIMKYIGDGKNYTVKYLY